MTTEVDNESEEVRTLFLELLKPENNDYKHRTYYHDYIVNTTDDLTRQLINIRLFIKQEFGICRCNGKENERILEVQIMKKSKQILLNAMPTYLKNLNLFLETEKHIVYKKTDFKCLSYIVNCDAVEEYSTNITRIITRDRYVSSIPNNCNQCFIPRNLESFRELKKLNNITDNTLMLDDLINYFRCLLFCY